MTYKKGFRERRSVGVAALGCNSASPLLVRALPSIPLAVRAFWQQSDVDCGRWSVNTTLNPNLATGTMPEANEDTRGPLPAPEYPTHLPASPLSPSCTAAVLSPAAFSTPTPTAASEASGRSPPDAVPPSCSYTWWRGCSPQGADSQLDEGDIRGLGRGPTRFSPPPTTQLNSWLPCEGFSSLSSAEPRSHPGGNPGANLKSISHRCYLRKVAF